MKLHESLQKACRFLSFLLLSLSVPVFALDQTVVDLSNSSKVINKLDGEWTFYPMAMVTPNSVGELKADDLEFMKVRLPQPWNVHAPEYYGSNTKEVNGAPGLQDHTQGFGYGTYSTVVKMPKGTKCSEQRIEFRRIKMNYRAYIDGRLLAEFGHPVSSDNSENAVNRYYPKSYSLGGITNCQSFRLTLQISNYLYVKGGVDGSIRIGPEETLRNQTLIYVAIKMIAFGLIFLSGFMALSYYLIGTKYNIPVRELEATKISKGRFIPSLADIRHWTDSFLSSFNNEPSREKSLRTHQLFAIICMTLGVRILVESEKILNYVFPNLGPELTLRVDLIGVFAAFPFVLFYMNVVIPNTVHRVALIYSAIHLIVTVTVGVFSLYWSGAILQYVYIYILLILLYMMIMSVVAYRREPNTTTAIFFASISVVWVASINDILYDLGIFQWYYVVNGAIALFAILNFFLLFREMHSLMHALDDRVTESLNKNNALIDMQTRRNENRERDISHFIHDSITGPIGAIRNKLGDFDLNDKKDFLASELLNIKEMCATAYDYSRQASRSIQPQNEVLEKSGLIAALRQASADMNTKDIRVLFEFSEECELSLPLEVQSNILFFAMESLTNSVKHCKGTVVVLSYKCSETLLSIEVEDDGCGFNLDADYKNGTGLLSMRNRANFIGAKLRFDSEIFSGTSVILTLDLDGHADQQYTNIDD
jgi:signal transduction histidine kinase